MEKKSSCNNAAKRRWTTEVFEWTGSDTNDENLMNLSAHEQEKFLLKDKINILDICDLFEIVKNYTSIRSLSVLIYLSLTHFGVSWRKTDLFLRQIGSFGAETCHKWGEVFLNSELDQFLEDGRGGQREPSFYDVFPKLENIAKLYALEACQMKSASFTSLELAQYLDKQYYDLTENVRALENLNLFGSQSETIIAN